MTLSEFLSEFFDLTPSVGVFFCFVEYRDTALFFCYEYMDNGPVNVFPFTTLEPDNGVRRKRVVCAACW